MGKTDNFRFWPQNRDREKIMTIFEISKFDNVVLIIEIDH